MVVTLFLTIIPLLVLIGLGFLVGRLHSIPPSALGAILINVVNPFVTFCAVAQIELKAEYAVLPFIIAGISSAMALTGLAISRLYWKDTTPNLIGLACIAGNSTYFALPVFALLLPPEWTGVYLLTQLGMQFSEATLGYYIGARGHFSVKESLLRLLKLPPLHGALWGLVFNLMGFHLSDIVVTYWQKALGTVVFVGMMLIGVALSKVEDFTINKRMLLILMLMRCIAWPIMCLGVVFLDKYFIHAFPAEVHVILALLGIIPLPANSIAYATQLHLKVPQIAACVLISTLFALFYVPAMIFLLQEVGILGSFLVETH